jgi:hypothetical protein
MDAIYACRIIADYYDLPDDTRYNASANFPKKNKSLEEEVTIDDSKQSLQTILLILSSEGTDTRCINQKAQLNSARLSRINYLQTG